MLLRLITQLFHRGPKAAQGFESGHALLEAGRLEAAIAVADALCSTGESLARGLYLKALVAERKGDLQEALRGTRMAVQADPEEPVYRLKLAEWLFFLGDYRSAAIEYEAALSIPNNPYAGDPIVLFRAAGACERAAMLEQAQARLEQALVLRPGFAEARANLATILALQGAAEEARKVAAMVRPQSAALRLRQALFLPAIYSSIGHIRETRERFERDIDALMIADDLVLREPEIEVGLTAFRLAYHGEDDLPLMRKLAALIRKAHAPPQTPVAEARRKQRMRVGFVSTYFWGHSVGRAALPLVRQLDRGRFEVLVFSIAPRADAVSAGFRGCADSYVELPPNVAQVAQTIREAAPDALVFTDIGMHPITYFLAFRRLAPVQCALAGHPVTTGIDTIDAFVSGDETEVADAQSHYSERLWRVPGFFLSIADPPRERSVVSSSRSRYLCPQSLMKLHPEFDDLLAGILDSDPDAGIEMFADPSPLPNFQIRKRLEKRLGANWHRIVLRSRLGYADYLSRLAGSSVVLDTPRFGGGNTTLEALALGVPVVTLPARFLRGRFAFGCYRRMGIQDCVARDGDEYVRTAVMLARDPDARAALGHRLREASTLLFDTQGAIQGFESRLQQALVDAPR